MDTNIMMVEKIVEKIVPKEILVERKVEVPVEVVRYIEGPKSEEDYLCKGHECIYGIGMP
jgi:hypothetical protein